MALIVKKLAQLIREGLSFEQIQEQIHAYMHKTHLLFMLESVENLAKNGRVSPLIAKAVGILGIRIVGKASDSGTLQQLHKCRGERKALDTLLKEMENYGFQGGNVDITHCLNPSCAENAAAMIRQRYPDAQITIRPSAGLCSFYAEKGSIMVGFEG